MATSRVLFSDPKQNRSGYIGDAGFMGPDGPVMSDNHGVNTPASATWDPYGGGDEAHGGGYQVVNGYRQMGTSAYDRDVARYRAMAGARQAPVALDGSLAGQSRGVQMGALGALQGAAAGNAPSQAAILGRANTEAASAAAMQQAAAARGGPGAQIAAMRGAQMGAAQGQLAAGGGALGMASRELGTDLSRYAQGAQGARAGDIAFATKNAQLGAQQNALNAQNEQFYERLGYDVRGAQQQAALDYQRRMQTQAAADRQAIAARRQREHDEAMGAATMAAGAVSGLLSDARAKVVMGSLGSMFGGR